eukprot:gene21093-27980_t
MVLALTCRVRRTEKRTRTGAGAGGRIVDSGPRVRRHYDAAPGVELRATLVSTWSALHQKKHWFSSMAFAGSLHVQESTTKRCARPSSTPARSARRVDTAAFSRVATDSSGIRPISPQRNHDVSEHPFWKTTRAIKSHVSTIVSTLSTMSIPFGNYSQQMLLGTTRKLSLSARSNTTLAYPIGQDQEKQSPLSQSLSPSGSSMEAAAAESSKDTSPLHAFLRRADYLEVQYTSMLADLSNLAYEVGKINPDMLAEHHNLNVIATSASCPLGPDSRSAWGREHVVDETRGQPNSSMSKAEADYRLTETVLVGLDADHQNPSTLLSLSLNSSEIDPAASMRAMSHLTETGPAIPMPMPAEFSHHPEEYAKAIHCPVAPLPCSDKQQEWVNEYLSSQAHLPTVPPLDQERAAAKDVFEKAQDCQVNPAPLTDWFACDDPITNIRYFCIKGSDSLEHWQINLQFEAVVFESPELGVMIHSGVYEAALKLYHDLLPLIRQHVATSPFATVCFTGHSLGGSLASVLMLLLVQRGELPAEALSPCYTFGAPAVFCGGAADMAVDRAAEQEEADDPWLTGLGSSRSTRHSGLLTRLGLGQEKLVNVIMHKDICPRVFVCDYTIVSHLLKAWMPSFKDHSMLQDSHDHKLLYNFIGRVAILRPDDDAPFVRGDAHHPMLPDAPGLYKLYEPQAKSSKSCVATRSLDDISWRHFHSPNQSHTVASSTKDLDVHSLSHSFTISSDGSCLPSGLPSISSEKKGDPVLTPDGSPITMCSALLKFMNYPHPLAMLVDSASYGHNGSISRYHNPENYRTCLVRVAQLKSPGLQSQTPYY